MKRAVLLAAALSATALTAAPARAQEPAAVYQPTPSKGFRFAGDGLARY